MNVIGVCVRFPEDCTSACGSFRFAKLPPTKKQTVRISKTLLQP